MWTVDEVSRAEFRISDGIKSAYCFSRELADKIAMALNFQESQLTKGQYPPVEGKQ